jgi:SAM-dependent methyltransferase
MSYKKQDRCLVCGSSKLVPYLNLGEQPLANANHKGQREQQKYPLGVQVCQTCYHSQLTHKVDNRLMFDDYIYVSGTSETLTNYFRQFTNTVMKAWKGSKPPRILEIACNDGTLLDMFRHRGCEVVGIDPAKNLTQICTDKGIYTWTKYWDVDTAELLLMTQSRFDIVIAINVLPHVPDPKEFMKACKMVLDPKTKGSGIYIQTSQCDMFKNGEFDAIYHEHHSYFTVSSFGTLAYGTDLEIKEASKVPIHSMSFLFRLGPMSGTGHCDKLFDLLEEENAGRWHTVERYKEWGCEVFDKRTTFRALLASFKEPGTLVVGYGASAKANTVLNFFDLSLDYIVDDNPMKWGLSTPGRNIPIIPTDDPRLKATQVRWVMTSWNFKHEVLSKIQKMRSIYSWPEFVFSYIPDVKVEPLFNYGRSETENDPA